MKSLWDSHKGRVDQESKAGQVPICWIDRSIHLYIYRDIYIYTYLCMYRDFQSMGWAKGKTMENCHWQSFLCILLIFFLLFPSRSGWGLRSPPKTIGALWLHHPRNDHKLSYWHIWHPETHKAGEGFPKPSGICGPHFFTATAARLDHTLVGLVVFLPPLPDTRLGSYWESSERVV